MKLNLHKLDSEFIPNEVGADGEDARVRLLRRLVDRGHIDRANKLFERFHKRGMKWADRLKD